VVVVVCWSSPLLLDPLMPLFELPEDEPLVPVPLPELSDDDGEDEEPLMLPEPVLPVPVVPLVEEPVLPLVCGLGVLAPRW
jgi:hypothetical protein